MKVAYIDCFAGISGDMMLGALVDAGLSLDALRTELAKLRLHEFELRSQKVKKHGISATKVDVIAEEGHVHRHLKDIVDIIEGSGISDKAKQQATSIFQRLAEAEAEVHGTSVDSVHFHEVGAVDAIVDVVGAAVGLDLLGVEKIYASGLRFGRGSTRGSHGAMPIPVPAVVALCKGLPAERTDIPFELVTPTGAAILTTLACKIGERVMFRTESIGYGAGYRDLEQLPNLLRLEIGECDTGLQEDAPILIETNIDDMTPEIYGYLVDLLLTEGARDAYLTPLVMKKGRPGVMLSVLAEPPAVQRLTDIVFRETTTLGVRISQVNRQIIPRHSATVETDYGTVAVKVAEYARRTRVSPEFEDCARIAREQNLPILEVYNAVARAAGKAQKTD